MLAALEVRSRREETASNFLIERDVFVKGASLDEFYRNSHHFIVAALSKTKLAAPICALLYTTTLNTQLCSFCIHEITAQKSCLPQKIKVLVIPDTTPASLQGRGIAGIIVSSRNN